MRSLCFASLFAFATSGCIVGSVAKTAVDVVSIPVKVVGAGVDAATTSQSEADEKRGRQLRREDERRAKDDRSMRKRCDSGRPQPDDRCSPPTYR